MNGSSIFNFTEIISIKIDNRNEDGIKELLNEENIKKEKYNDKKNKKTDKEINQKENNEDEKINEEKKDTDKKKEEKKEKEINNKINQKENNEDEKINEEKKDNEKKKEEKKDKEKIDNYISNSNDKNGINNAKKILAESYNGVLTEIKKKICEYKKNTDEKTSCLKQIIKKRKRN